MTGSSGLPLVGAEVVLLGTQAFNANVTSVARQILSVGDSFKAAEAASAASAVALTKWADASGKAIASFGRLGAPYLADFAKQSQAAAVEAQRVATNAGVLAAAFRLQAEGATAASKAASEYAERVSGTRAASAAAVAAEEAERKAVEATKLAKQTASDAVKAADQATTAILKARADAEKNIQVAAKASAEAQIAYNESVIVSEEAAAAATKARLLVVTLGAAAVGVALVAGLAASEKAAAQYNQQLTSIGAISGATAAQVGRLNDVQLNLARSQTQNAGQVEQLTQALVRDGVSVDKVNASVLKAANSMILLSNGELSAGEAAKIQAQALNVFGTTAENAANASTAAVTRSTIGWSGFAAAISNAGAIAARDGLSINQFAAIVGTAGKTMQDGSAIGAGFRQMLERLDDPGTKASVVLDKYKLSLYDANGATRPFVDVLKALEDAFGPAAIASGKLTAAERDEAEASLFGARSVEFLNALLLQGTQGFNEMLDATNKVNAADIANKTLAPTAAQAKILQTNIGALAIAFGQGLDPVVRQTTSDMVKFTQSMDLNQVREFGQLIGTLALFLERAAAPFKGRYDPSGTAKQLDDALKYAEAVQKGRDQSKQFADASALVAHWLEVGSIDQAEYNRRLTELATNYAKATDSVKNYGTALDQSERHQGSLATTGAPTEGVLASAASTKALADAQEKAAKIGQDFNRAVADETEKTTDQINKLYRNTYEQITKATQENADAVAKINSDTARQIADLQSAEVIKKDQETRRAALEQQLKDEEEARKETRQAEDAANKRDTEDRKNALQQQTKDAEDAYKRIQDDEAETNKLRVQNEEATAKEEQRVREDSLKAIQDAESEATKHRQEQDDLYLKERQQNEEEAAKQLQQDETDRLKKHQEDLAASLKADEDAREQSLKNTFEIENKRLDLEHQLQDVATKDQRDRAQAEYEYQQDIQRGVKESIAQARLQQKLGQTAQATGQARVKIADQSQQTQETLNVQQSQQQREAVLRAQFDKEQLDQKRRFEEDTRALEIRHENETLRARQKTEEDTLKARQRTEDETDRMRRTHEEQRNALAETFRKEDLARSQKNEQDDIAFKRRQEDAYSGYRLGLEQAELAAMRTIEDEDAKRRAVREQEDINNQAQQAQQRLDLQKRFDDEDLARRIQVIYQERDARIAAANEAFSKQRENLQTQLANEIQDLRTSLKERVDTIKRDYTDKLENLLADVGSRIEPLVRGMEAGIQQGLDNLILTANISSDAIAQALGGESQLQNLIKQRAALEAAAAAQAQADAEKLKQQYTAAAIEAARAATAGQPPDPSRGTQDIPGGGGTRQREYQYGGVVPGPYGSLQWVLAHGGERFEGIGMYGNTLTAVRMAESMQQRGMGGSTHVSNQYSYTVHANYGRTQAEGSVRRDLSALVMLTRG